MVPEQKRSIFLVVVFSLSILLFLALIPLIGIKAAWAGFGLTGLGGLAPVLFRNKRRAGEVEWDERDVMIGRKAALIAVILSYMTFVAACMVLWFVHMWQGNHVISIHVLPLIVCAGGFVLFVGRAVAILILYGSGKRDGEE